MDRDEEMLQVVERRIGVEVGMEQENGDRGARERWVEPVSCCGIVLLFAVPSAEEIQNATTSLGVLQNGKRNSYEIGLEAPKRRDNREKIVYVACRFESLLADEVVIVYQLSNDLTKVPIKPISSPPFHAPVA